MRVVIEMVLLFMMPAILVFGYLHVRRGPRSMRETLDDMPLGWLGLAGCALLFVVLVLFASREGIAPDKPYVPGSSKTGGFESLGRERAG